MATTGKKMRGSARDLVRDVGRVLGVKRFSSDSGDEGLVMVGLSHCGLASEQSGGYGWWGARVQGCLFVHMCVCVNVR